jgi:hypothetical protein
MTDEEQPISLSRQSEIERLRAEVARWEARFDSWVREARTDPLETVLRQLTEDELDRVWESLNAICDHADDPAQQRTAEAAIKRVQREQGRRFDAA